jgi:hypothetical protein
VRLSGTWRAKGQASLTDTGSILRGRPGGSAPPPVESGSACFSIALI